ncbi:MAG: hypothetical protein V1818_01080 [Candidatus Aenigmatarchaeota archaeon]
MNQDTKLIVRKLNKNHDMNAFAPREGSRGNSYRGRNQEFAHYVTQ